MPVLELSPVNLLRCGVRILWLALLPLFVVPARGQYLVSGRVTDGSSAVAGVTVTALGQSTGGSATTDASGNYALTLPLDTYSVSASKTGVDFAPVSCLLDATCSTNAVVTVSPTAPSQTNVNFSVVYSIGGRVLEGAAGLSGVSVSVQSPFPQTATTDAGGNYTLPRFQRGAYVVTPVRSGYTFDPATLTLSLASNVTTANFAAHALFTVNGRVSNGRSPLAGVTVKLQNSLTTVSQQTDSTGSYSFTNLTFDTYTLIPALTGYSFNPPSATVTGPATVNFSVTTQGLSGRVTDAVTGFGVGGVAVDASNGTNTTSATTDPNGYYAFKNLAGSYIITPSLAGHTFNPAHRTLSAASESNSVDFQQGPTLTDTLVTTCDFPSLELALGNGGAVGFDCGGSVGTIVFTEPVTIRTNTTLNATGSGAVLSGGNAARLFTVNAGAGLRLNGKLTLTAGADTGAAGTNGSAGVAAGGGAILNDGGFLVLTGCVFSGNAATGGNGGAGVQRLTGQGGNGGGGGDAFGGAILNRGGSVYATNCSFLANTASGGAGGAGADAGAGGNGNDAGAGGAGGTAGGAAIYNTGGGTVVISECTFSSNRVSGAAGGTGGTGTGLGSNGGNGGPGPALGGGLLNTDGSLTVVYSTFLNNQAAGAQGGDGKAGVGESNGSGGTAGSLAAGGAIYNGGGSLVVTNCTLDSNVLSGGQGGAGGAGGSSGFGGNGGNGGSGGSASGGAICNVAPGTTLVVNATVTGNEATGGSGGAGGGAGSSVARTGHDGADGASAGGGVANTSGTFTLVNTIVGYSAFGGNGAGTVTDGGFNLSDDSSLSLSPAAGSLSGTNLDLGLGLPGDYGGSTWTVPVLVAQSPAVDAGNDAAAPPTDQRRQPRFGRSDIGAFEFVGTASPALLSIRLQTNFVLVSWTNTLAGYALQSAAALPAAAWTTETNLSQSGNAFVFSNAVTDPGRFYRLIK